MKSRILPLFVRGMALAYFAMFVAFIAWIDAGMGPFPVSAYVIYGAVTSFILFFVAGATYISARARLLYFGLYAACLAIAYLLPLSPCEPLVNALNRVRPGMTRAEVTQIMRGFQESSYRPSDAEEDLCYKHSLDADHDKDCASVTLVAGRVVATDWSPER